VWRRTFRLTPSTQSVGAWTGSTSRRTRLGRLVPSAGTSGRRPLGIPRQRLRRLSPAGSAFGPAGARERGPESGRSCGQPARRAKVAENRFPCAFLGPCNSLKYKHLDRALNALQCAITRDRRAQRRIPCSPGGPFWPGQIALGLNGPGQNGRGLVGPFEPRRPF